MVEGTSRTSVTSLFPEISGSSLDTQYDSLVQSFKNASSASDLSNLVKQIDADTKQVDFQLAQFVGAATRKHTQELSAVELTRARLSRAIFNSNELTKVFSSASDLGRTLTTKIRALDQEIGNVNCTLSFVADTQSLKNNINEISYAIEKKNWEAAARCIHTINHDLNPNLVAGHFASAVIPSTEIPELPTVSITNWVNQLTQEFTTLFDDAARRRNVPEITKYFQLFPLIDQEEVGLNCYAKFICSIIVDTSRTLINSAMQSETKQGIYANAMSSLFESISIMLSQHSPLITKYYSDTYPRATVYVVNKIQREIDAQIGTIADTFYDVSRVDKTLQDIKLHNFTFLKKHLADNMSENASNSEVLDNDVASIVEVGDLANEFAAIMHHWALYCKFITVKYFNGSSEDTMNGKEGLKLPELLASSHFNKKIRNKYLPAFESLYSFYFRRSLEKAITIEELPSLEPFLRPTAISKSPESPPISSVIEDVTLVFNNTLRNVLDSAQTSTVKKFVSETFKLIQKDLVNGLFQKVLNENQPRYNNILSLSLSQIEAANNSTPSMSRSGTPAPESVGGFFKGASSAFGNVVGTGSAIVSAANPGITINNPKLFHFIIYLNTVATGQEFFEQIVNNVTLRNPGYLKSNFPFGIDEEKMSHTIRDELLAPFVDTTSAQIKQSLLKIFNHSIKNKVATMISDCFPESNEENYMVYSSTALNDNGTILKFKDSWDSIIKPYRQTLHKALLYDKLLRLIVVNVASMIEKKLTTVLKKFKINELGALKLDKDLSYIINEICEDDYDLREKFVRVTQLVLLVGMDNEEYEMSFYHTGDEDNTGISWVLTPLERKQIRRFRV